MKSIFIRKTRGDIVFDAVNYTVLTIGMLLVLYPLYFVVIASISDPNAIYEGRVMLIPKGVNLEGYKRILNESSIWVGYANTILYTVVGTTINVVITLMAAFTLSRKNIPLGKIIMYMVVFTMFFNGGMIPTYILIQKLGWINTMWALIIPTAVGPWNLIIARTFFQNSIPDELCEAAYIDGTSHFLLFYRIVLPLSKALIVILILFYSLNHWNSFFNALIYIRDEAKYPLTLVLRNILLDAEMSANMMADEASVAEKLKMADLIKYGSIILATVPILSLYPFAQKYFVQGVMIGAVKG